MGPEQFPRAWGYLKANDPAAALAIKLIAERLGLGKDDMPHDRHIGHLVAMVAASGIAGHSLGMDQTLPEATKQKVTDQAAIRRAAKEIGSNPGTVSKASLRGLKLVGRLNKLRQPQANNLETDRPTNPVPTRPDSTRPPTPGAGR